MFVVPDLADFLERCFGLDRARTSFLWVTVQANKLTTLGLFVIATPRLEEERVAIFDFSRAKIIDLIRKSLGNMSIHARILRTRYREKLNSGSVGNCGCREDHNR